MLVLAVFIALPAVADRAGEGVVNGATSCREWSTLRASGKDAAAELWLSGLLLNLSAGEDGGTLDDAALASSTAWMDGFCRQQPTATIGKGAAMLYQELKRQRDGRQT